MDWLGILTDVVLPIITIALSTTGAYFGAKRAKTSAYREMLYSKQMEACAEIIKSANNLRVIGYQIWNGEREQYQYEETDLDNLYVYSIYLPEEMSDAITKFRHTFFMLTSNHVTVTKQETSHDFGYAYLDLIQTARKSLGVEPLSQETASLIGKPVGLRDKQTSIPPT